MCNVHIVKLKLLLLIKFELIAVLIFEQTDQCHINKHWSS